MPGEFLSLFVIQLQWIDKMKITADDIIFQLVPLPAIPLLRELAEKKIPPPHLQLWCPAMGNILLSYTGEQCPEPLFKVAQWLSDRAQQVYSSLLLHTSSPPTNIAAQGLYMDWRVSGSWYGRPPIQARPSYPGIPGDGMTEAEIMKEETKCRKYYGQYKKACLTGGLMILWCTHSIRLGFHIMPKAEGCNNVFSAIYTHWPVAPKIIVYDFACQLAPYCLIREPGYFGQTCFVVNEFHTSDHTKCSRASHTSFVMQYDPQLQAINTSAAEIGNSGASKIRKSVSYMTQ